MELLATYKMKIITTMLYEDKEHNITTYGTRKKKIDLVHNNHYVLSTTCPDSKDIGIESANVMFYRKSLIS